MKLFANDVVIRPGGLRLDKYQGEKQVIETPSFVADILGEIENAANEPMLYINGVAYE